MTQRLYPYRTNGRFYNYKGEQKKSYFLTSVLLFLHSWLKRKSIKRSIQEWISQESLCFKQDPSILWIGHSTFVIRLAGLTIVTDPIFTDITFLFRRITSPILTVDQLPKVDLILLSHNHRDHMDLSAIKQLAKLFKPLILVPEGDKKLLEWHGIENVEEFMWWDQRKIGNILCTFLPAYHWSQRSIFDRNRSLWGSWMLTSISENFNLYFAGDTAYGQHFKHIAREFPSIDAALMPIGPCEPHKWMKLSHINAEEAVDAFLELNAQHFIPMHWGTFYFGIDQFLTPIDRLQKAWSDKSKLLENRLLHLMKFGQQTLLTPTPLELRSVLYKGPTLVGP